MNNLSPLGLITCFIFSMLINGASFNNSENKGPDGSAAYVINHSHSVVYFKPESKDANPGLESDAAYAIAPGESLYAPVDAVVTAATTPGKIFRIPTGARIIVNEKGIPEPANIIARSGLMFSSYGTVNSPCASFAKLSNSKHILYRAPDITMRHL
jgi:hypothetical protein